MLNRIFVIIGVLVICAIAAAFIVPRFIQWGDYRERLQTMATGAFGTEVAIEGDIQLTLLPQPRLEFTKVRVGPRAAPVASIDKVEANLSLLDFLRDQYNVTGLVLSHPVINFALGADGRMLSGIAIANTGGQSNVSIADANVVDGAITLSDARSGTTYAADKVDGELKLDALDGPFNFQGTTNFGGAGYGIHLTTGKFADDGSTALSIYLKASDDAFTLESSGTLQAGATPKYKGDLTFRLPPPKPKEGETVDAGRGDFVLTGKAEADAAHVLFTEYMVIPDENRSATRLSGAAELKLGKDVSFNAVVSGGVVALPPRDATKELTDPPYELVRLLGELPLPPVPSIAGTVGIDIDDLNLRAVSLRNLRLDAATDTKSWSIKGFAATLPGGAKVGLTGNLQTVEGKPIFAGGVTLDTQRLDLLAGLYRKPNPDSPLFNMPGSLSADVALSGDTLTLSSGTVVIDGINQNFDAAIGFGTTRSLKLSAHFTTLGAAESAALGALMPDVGSNGSFGATFPKGEVDLSASKAVLFGLDGTDLAAAATWDGGVLEFSKLSAADLGGAAFDAKLTAFGTLTKPELSGGGTLTIEDNAPAVATLLGAVSTPPAVADFLRRSLPADLNLQLDAPSGDGGQTLTVTGKLGTADAKLEAKLGTGIVTALRSPIDATLDLTSESPHLLAAQIGLGKTPLFDDRTPLHVSASVQGVPSNSYVTHVALEDGDDSIVFDGNVVPGDFTKISGEGPLTVKLTDPAALVEALGAGGIHVPPIDGKANLTFDGLDTMTVSEIDTGGVTGSLTLSHASGTPTVTGTLALKSLDVAALLPAVAGPASVVSTNGPWPDGPLDIGTGPRTTEGRVDVSIASVTAGGKDLVTGATMGFDWDAKTIHVRDLDGAFGGGTLAFDATLCCSNPLAAKQISGRLSVAGATLDSVVPGPIAGALEARFDGAAQFDSSGETLAQAITTLSGTGSYTMTGLSAAHFDPAIFKGVGALQGVVDMAPEDLTKTVTDKLGAEPFAAPSATGTFTIAGGVLRSPNLGIVGDGARVFGGATLSLKDFSLDARYAMTPTGSIDPGSLVDPTAEVAAVVTGPLWSPNARYDVASLVDSMKIKASEIELAVLEQRKKESEDRIRAAMQAATLRSGAKAATAGAAQQLALQAATEKAAQEAAAKAAAEAAARKAAQDAAARDLGM